MRNTGLDGAQAGIKIAGRTINNLRYADDTTLMAENEVLTIAFVTLCCDFWRRKWQPTPVFSPGESQGQRSLVGCRLWSRTELDTTEAT